ncbi:MAG: dienelactone hydrolase family protein [Pseudomonadota bacterium]|nr:dienelactone hydrolase family protein [Pseudomonadota bacterium]
MLKQIMTPILLTFAIYLGHLGTVSAEPIYHQKLYPDGAGPFPAVIVLHSSGGPRTTEHVLWDFNDSGFAVYFPYFLWRHRIKVENRMDTFSIYREPIEKELAEIVELMKKDPKVDKNNIFAVGYSNGGFWAGFLSGKALVNAGVSYYGVWKACSGSDCENEYPMEYFSENSSPMLALHGDSDSKQDVFDAESAWDEIRGSKAKLESHIYKNAEHGWDLGHLPRWKDCCYNKEVTKDAYKRTIAFFKKHMK